MPLYTYQAIDGEGKKRSGSIDAHGEREAKATLRDQGLMVSSIGLKSSARGKENLKGDQLLAFTMQFSQLLNAGVPVYESLLALEEQYRGEPCHQVILSLCDQIKSGKDLSTAMTGFPNSFDRLYCSMIAAGESAGALDKVLEKLAELLAKQSKLKREITTAMIYPAVLASFAFLVIILLLGFVVPSIEGIFAGRELNGFTQFVLNVSHIFRDYWWAYIPVIVAIIAYVVYFLRTPNGKLWLESNLMRLPMISRLMTQAAIARFCRTMSTLLGGGLTIIDSLRIGRKVMQNNTLEKEIERAEQRIIEGSSLSRELIRSKWIPKMVSRMLAVGEDSGSTVRMMEQIAEIYEAELDKTLARVMALAQPVILIVMGGIIGTVMLAILLPLTDMSSFTM